MGLGIKVSTTPFTGGVNITYYVLLALVSAFIYYVLRSISTNKYVPIAIGIALTFFTTGYLEQAGLVVLAIGISRLMEQELNLISSS